MPLQQEKKQRKQKKEAKLKPQALEHHFVQTKRNGLSFIIVH